MQRESEEAYRFGYGSHPQIETANAWSDCIHTYPVFCVIPFLPHRLQRAGQSDDRVQRWMEKLTFSSAGTWLKATEVLKIVKDKKRDLITYGSNLHLG